MANKIFKPVLTEHQMLKFQRRLSSYLRDYEYRNNLQAQDVAKEIDISPQKFSYVKSEKKPFGKFITSIDFLAKLANLEKMSVSEFVEYLDGKRDKEIETVPVKVFGWQKTLIESFEPLTIKVRGVFLDICKQSLKDGKKKLEALIEIVNLLKDKDLDAIESFRDGLKKIT